MIDEGLRIVEIPMSVPEINDLTAKLPCCRESKLDKVSCLSTNIRAHSATELTVLACIRVQARYVVAALRLELSCPMALGSRSRLPVRHNSQALEWHLTDCF